MIGCAAIVFFSERMQAAQRRAHDRVEELETLMDMVPLAIYLAHDSEAGRSQATARPRASGSRLRPKGPQPPSAGPYRFLQQGVELDSANVPIQRAVREKREIRNQEYELVLDDGTRRRIFGNASPLHDEDGRVRGGIAAFLDVTELERVEQALRDTDRRKDEFLAMLAHELRNPLGAVSNAVQVLHLQGPADGPNKRGRDVIDRQVAHLTRIVDDLLDVSRVTQGRIVLDRRPLALEAAVHLAVETALPGIESRKVDLRIVLPPDPVVVEGDLNRLAQVLGNLLNNAAKYNREGGRIDLVLAREGSDAVVTVSDTGEGIAPEVLPHVFELFTQGERSLERSQGGLGIGLTLVRRLVEMHGGSVEARSDGQGRGSAFTVRLPIVEGVVPVSDPSPAASSNGSDIVGRRILVVDDNADAAEALTLMLRIEGAEVETAFDGIEALATAARFRPEIVFLDIGLPNLNGYEVARRIRGEAWGRDLVLIALTGWGRDQDRRQSTAAGFTFHLTKPVDLSALKTIVAKTPIAPPR